MHIPSLHAWPSSVPEAIALQKTLAGRVDANSPLQKCDTIAGADCSYLRGSPGFYAAVVVLRVADGSVVEVASAVGESPFPYVPGLLSFREAPLVLQAFAKLRRKPDAVMLDGQGVAHPRGFGLACHLGLWLDLPCFGCAKTVLCGEYRQPGPRAGSATNLVHKDLLVGQAVRTKDRTRPVFVSVGHKIDLASAVRWTLACCKGYRIPEPTRQAHLEVNRLRLREKG